MKELIKLMTFYEIMAYIERHPNYRLPSFNEANRIVSNYPEFWISDTVNDRKGCFNRGRLEESHPLFRKHCVLIRK